MKELELIPKRIIRKVTDNAVIGKSKTILEIYTSTQKVTIPSDPQAPTTIELLSKV